jgi:hypothetical protein
LAPKDLLNFIGLRCQENPALTPALRIPKMTPEVQHISEVAMSPPTEPAYRNVFRAIATDLHFWIPLAVLAGGLVLMDKLR